MFELKNVPSCVFIFPSFFASYSEKVPEYFFLSNNFLGDLLEVSSLDLFPFNPRE